MTVTKERHNSLQRKEKRKLIVWEIQYGCRDTNVEMNFLIFCWQVNSDGRAIVMASFVQRSTVLSRSRGKMFDNGDELDPLYTPGDQYWGVHVSSCGHMMHSDCWQGFYTSVVVKERRALRLGQHFSVDITRREYLCPLCGCISNSVLPVLPALFSGRGEG